MNITPFERYRAELDVYFEWSSRIQVLAFIVLSAKDPPKPTKPFFCYFISIVDLFNLALLVWCCDMKSVILSVCQAVL
jgi:hypothetical protein